MEKENKRIHLPRRTFLKGAGASLAGLALTGGMAALLAGCDQGQGQETAGGSIKAPDWPFAYKKLDPDEAAEIAYYGYKEGG